MIEYLSGLPSDVRENIVELCYDDACHFKKYSENKERADLNEVTRFMSMIGKHVDKFHFPNHVDAWCHKHCNPQDVKHLVGVNTPICEQLFSSINKFTNAKAMNEAHFFIFFLYIFDLHNLQIEKRLRSTANPKSEYRYELIKKLKDEEIDEVSSLMAKIVVEEEESDEVADVHLNNDLEPNTAASEFSCHLCNANYKRAGNLKQHLSKKHNGESTLAENDPPKNISQHFRCLMCDMPFSELKYLNRHIKVQHSPVPCKICEKILGDKEEHDAHLEEHLTCDVCGKYFDKMFKLSRHIKTHK